MRQLFLQLAIVILFAGCTSIRKGPETLRVLTYNIHHGEGVDGKLDLERIAAVINAAKPDLVALQEVDRRTRRTGGVDQAVELARLTGMHHVYGAAMPYQGGEYGQAVLSRFPISQHRVHFLPQRTGREPRIALEAQVLGLAFVGTHLDHQIEDIRVRQAAELQSLFGSRTAPVVLVGDFNARPTNATMRVFSDWLDAAANNPQNTIPATNPRARIDYILLNPKNAWEVLETRVIEESVASDHRPVLSVLRRAK